LGGGGIRREDDRLEEEGRKDGKERDQKDWE